MDIASISPQLNSASLGGVENSGQSTSNPNRDPAKLAKASKQFEAILLRQILGESMKPMLESGPSGQVYGYMLTDALASKVSEEGGLGLAHVLQAQLGPKTASTTNNQAQPSQTPHKP